jgi:hypothetical protein
MEGIDLIQAVSSVGFPIVMCGVLFWYMMQESKSHKEETAALKDAIVELKIAITSLVTKIGE